MEVIFSDPILKAISQLGIFIVGTIALWYGVFVRRKDKEGKRNLSPLLIPGWLLDDQKASEERRVLFYKQALKDEQDRGTQRAQEWRALREEERAARKDAEEDFEQLLTALNSIGADVRDIIELVKSGTIYSRTPNG
jgi:hypothetical protein